MNFGYKGKISLLTQVLYFIAFIANSQQITYQISYDVGNMDLFGNVRQTNDNGYIIAGTDITFFGNAALIKTDTAGTVVWAKTYSGFFAFYTINDVRQTSDNGYIITGSKDAKLALIKTDANGIIQWSKEYGGSDGEGGNAVKQTSDGGYIVSGYTYSFSAKDSANFYLLKTNSTGVLTWDRVFEIGTIDDETGMTVEELPDGYIIAGSTTQVFGPDTTLDAVLIKTNLSGDLTWARTYGADLFSEEINDVKFISTGELLITGYSDAPSSGASDIFLMKTDTSGNINFSSSYNVGFEDLPYSVQETNDNGYASFGFTITNLFPLTIKAFLLKTNSLGAVQISRQYGAGVGAIFGKGQQTNDGGYVIGSMQGNTSWDFHIYKTDNTGATQCNESAIAATQNAYSPPVTIPTVTVFSGGTGGNISPSTNIITPLDSVYCLAAPCTPPPLPTLVVTDANVCVLQTGVTYTTQAGYSAYTWSVTGGAIASGQGTNSITVNWGTGPSGTVNLTIDSSGCGGTLATENISIANPTPTLSVTDVNVCEGQTSVIYTTQTGFTTYTWTVTGGTVASGAGTNSITVNWGTAGAGTVSLTVVDGNGCSGSLSEAVTVNANPSPTLTVTDTSVCEGETGVTYTTQAGFSTYTWTVTGGVLASGAGTNSITVNWGIAGGGTVNLTVVDGNGCSGSLSEAVTINANPSPTLTVTDTSVCEGETGVTYTTQAGFSTYTWTVTGGVLASGDGTNSITVNWGIAGGGTVNLTVVDVNGCSGSLSATESVTINTSPTANITPTGLTSFCTGDSIELQSDTASTYLWLLNGSSTGPVSQNIFITTPGNYQVVVTNSAGCKDTSAITTVAENPSPNANITSLSPATFCSGDSVTLQADTASVYNWLLGGISTGQITQSITVYTSGDYQVVVSNAFCYDTSAIVTVTVNSLPVIDTSSTVIDSTTCGNSIGSITGTTSSGTAPFTYQWMNSGSAVVGGDSLNLANIPADTYTLTVTDSTGCTASISFIVFSIGAPAAPLAGNDSTYCQGDSIAGLTATGSGGTLIWYSDAALTDSIGFGSPFNSGAIATDTFYVTETLNGCESAPDSVTVTFTPLPTVTITASQDTICPGGNVTLIASGADSYLWNTGDTGSVILVNPINDTTYLVTGFSNGCQSQPALITITTDSSLLPVVTIAPAADTVICQGSTITLTASGGNTYMWSTGDTAATIMVNPVVNTEYYVTTTSTNSCTSAADSISISIGGGGVVAGFTADALSGNIPLNVSFANTSIGAVGWQWDFSYNSILFNIESIVQNPSYTYTDAGQFEVILIAFDANGCSDTASLLIGVNAFQEVFIPSLFSPNGDVNNDILYVRGNGIDWLELIIYDRWGEKVFEGDKSQVWAKEGTYPNNIGWDGTFRDKPMNPAVLVYVLKGAFINGDEIDQKGNITLIR